jgi:putative dimethyl sulfoxide reductase chaperone
MNAGPGEEMRTEDRVVRANADDCASEVPPHPALLPEVRRDARNARSGDSSVLSPLGERDRVKGDFADQPTEFDITEAIAADLELLADLHDREPTREWLVAARACPIQAQLGLILESTAGRAALVAFDSAVAALPHEPAQADLDDLAAEYANIYLRFLYRASPTESVWIDEDGLEQQAPMFDVKAWYKRHNLVSQDWAKRPDDHLVIQLRFLAYLFAQAGSRDTLAEAARFLDEHLLRWAGLFAGRIAGETPLAYYAATAQLTHAYLDELRTHLEAAANLPRWVPEAPAPVKSGQPKLTCADEVRPYVPGTAPSW